MWEFVLWNVRPPDGVSISEPVPDGRAEGAFTAEASGGVGPASPRGSGLLFINARGRKPTHIPTPLCCDRRGPPEPGGDGEAQRPVLCFLHYRVSGYGKFGIIDQ